MCIYVCVCCLRGLVGLYLTNTGFPCIEVSTNAHRFSCMVKNRFEAERARFEAIGFKALLLSEEGKVDFVGYCSSL